MASCHIPWFLDGQPFARFDGGVYVDGSFRARRDDYLRVSPRNAGAAWDADKPIVIDPADDPRAPRDFLTLRSPEGVRDLYDLGRDFARTHLIVSGQPGPPGARGPPAVYSSIASAEQQSPR